MIRAETLFRLTPSRSAILRIDFLLASIDIILSSCSGVKAVVTSRYLQKTTFAAETPAASIARRDACAAHRKSSSGQSLRSSAPDRRRRLQAACELPQLQCRSRSVLLYPRRESGIRSAPTSPGARAGTGLIPVEFRPSSPRTKLDRRAKHQAKLGQVAVESRADD